MKQLVDLQKMMTIDLERIKLGAARKDIAIKNLRIFLVNVFKKWYDLKFSFGEKPMVFFYGKWNWREDHFKTFFTFTNRFPKSTRVYYEMRKKPRYTFFKGFIWLFYFLGLLIKNLFIGINLINTLIQLPYYQSKHETIKIFKRIKQNRFLILYYDVAPDENCLMQLFNNYGKTTATLQHGIFAEKETKKELADTALEYKYSESKYYLAWNKYTKEQAIKSGMSPEKIVVLGIPKYIDYCNDTSLLNSEDNVFGIILNNSDFELHNRTLIQMANNISDRLNFKYVVRYHPQMRGNEYNNIINEKCVQSGHDRRSIVEYAKSVRFTIMSSSSVFVDLVFLRHPVYRLILSDEDTYSEIKENAFNDITELTTLLNKEYDSNGIFDYLCSTRDIFNSYDTFFTKLMRGEII